MTDNIVGEIKLSQFTVAYSKKAPLSGRMEHSVKSYAYSFIQSFRSFRE